MAIGAEKVTVKVSGAATAFTNEATTTDGGRKTFQISDSTKQVWDRSASITVETSPDGTTWTPVTTGFVLDRLFGKVIFDAQQASGISVRVSGQYLPMTAVSEAHSWTDNGSTSTSDVTPFGASFKRFIANEQEMSGDLSDFNVLDKYYKNALTAGNPVVLEFDDSVEVFRAWGLLNKDEVKSAVGSASDASVSWTGTADSDGRVMSVG